MTVKKLKNSVLLAALFLGGFTSAATAQDVNIQTTAPVVVEAEAPIDILPAARAQEEGYEYADNGHTHPAIKLTPDKSELVRLDKAAGSIIIGNPNHLSVLADSSQTLVLVPRAPGATHFVVLSKQGEVIMQRHVIVASPKEKYVRVRRSCAGTGDDSCQSTSVFYCPDMCHEIMIDAGDGSGGSSNGGENGNGGGDSSSSEAPPANGPDTSDADPQ